MNILRKLARLLLLSITTLAIGYFVLVRIGILPVQAAVGINKQINFQGKVTNSDGTNVTNGSYTFVFSLYTASSGGVAVWTETKSLTVTDGVFRTALGDTQALPGSVDFNSNNIYLGVNFNSDGEMTPRIQFTAAPYAFNSDTLDGLDSSSFLRSDTSAAYTAGTLTFNTGTTLSVNGDLAVGDTSVTFSAGSTVLNFTSSNGPHQIVTAGTSNFALMPGGKVGIGYTAPGTKLTIAGGLAIGNSAGTSAYVTKLAPDGGAIFEGNVGIGTTNPSLATLQVEGMIRVATTGAAASTNLCLGTNNIISGCSASSNLSGSGAAGQVTFWTGSNTMAGNNNFWWDSANSKLGIGTSAPINTVTVSGNGNITGNLGVGITSPTTKLHVNGGLTVGYGEGTTTPPANGVIINGNVGIGTSAPGLYKLNVNGNTNIGGTLAAGSLSLPNSHIITGITDYTNFSLGIGISAATGNPVYFINKLGNATLNVLTLSNGTASLPSLTFSGDTDSSTGLFYPTTDSLGIATSGVERVRIIQNGSLGIGITSPNTKLSVNGNAIIGYGEGVGFTAPSNGLIVNGNVGIGSTANTLANLDVNGTIRVGSTATATTAHLCLGANNVLAGCSGGGGGGVGGSGTTNYIAMWSDSGNITTSALYQTSSNVGIGYTAPASKLTVSGGLAVGNSSGSSSYLSKLAPDGGAIFENSVGIGTTAPIAMLDINQPTNTLGFNLTANANTTANIAAIAGNSLTSGNLLSLTSTSIGLTTGSLLSLDWSPVSSTTATGDLFSLNIGANGNITNLFNIKNNGSSIFSVSQTQITAGVPMSINAPGDVGLNNDLAFLNSSVSNITSIAPLAITAGEVFGSSNLTLATYNSGNVIVNSQAFTTSNAASISGQLVVGTQLPDSANIGNFYLTNDVVRGKALAILNQTENQDIFTASASGATRFVIKNNGNVGIGTTNPSLATLQVEGTVRIGSTGAASSTQLCLGTNNVLAGCNGGSLSGSGTANYVARWTSSTAVGSGVLYDNATNVGIGITSPNSKLSVNGGIAVGYGEGTTSSPANGAIIAGNVGIGTSAPISALNVLGDVVIGAEPDSSAGSTFTLASNTVAGTFASQAAVTGAYQTVIFKGKVFVATKKNDAAGVYRLDAGGWTLVTNSAGKAVSGDTANIDAYILSTFNGALYIGSQNSLGTGGSAAVYVSTSADTTADSFTMINATRGQFDATTGANTDVSDMEIYNGNLYVFAAKANAAGIYRYNGGTNANAFTMINSAVGKFLTADAADIDSGVLQVYGGRLIAGAVTGSTTGRVAEYNGKLWVNLNVTRGTFDTVASEPDVTSMAVFNGSLFIATKKTNAANIYRFNGGPAAGVANSVPFKQVNAAAGQIISTDPAASVTSVVMREYNGRLYVGSNTGTGNSAAIYEYDPTIANTSGSFTMVNATRGTFGSQTNIDAVDTLMEYNGTLYVGTEESTNIGAVYTWYKNSTNSYALKFDSGSANYGEISFVGNQQVANHAGHMGTFLFSNSISMVTGAFDYAEDYPTVDDSLEAGDIVQIDPENKQYVRKSQLGSNAIGIISEKPGFRLSLQDADKNGVTYLPVALVGRVPVKVSTENGAIKAGDYLMPSSVAGVAMRATTSGMIIGQAMEAFDSEGIGKIVVFVQTSQFNGSLVAGLRGLDPQGAALSNFEGDETGERILKLLMKKQEATGLSGLSNSEIFTDRVVAQKEIIAPKIFADTIIAKKIKAESIEGIEVLTQKMLQLNELMASSSAQTAEATASASVASVKVPGLEVEGTATVAAQLHVGGSALIEGVLNVVDSITGTNLIVGHWADFLGSVIFRSDVNFLGRPVFNKDTAGVAVIKKDTQRVDVVFEKEYTKRPVVNATLSLSDEDTTALKESELRAYEQKLIEAGYSYFITKTGTKGFTIVLNKPALQDVRFSWVALAVSDDSLSESSPAAPSLSTKANPVP